LPGRPAWYRPTAGRLEPPLEDSPMIRNYFFGSLTAFCLLALGACGGEKNSTDTNVAPSDGSTSETTDPGTESGTTGPGTTEVGETNSTVPGTTDGTTGPDDSTTAMAPTT